MLQWENERIWTPLNTAKIPVLDMIIRLRAHPTTDVTTLTDLVTMSSSHVHCWAEKTRRCGRWNKTCHFFRKKAWTLMKLFIYKPYHRFSRVMYWKNSIYSEVFLRKIFCRRSFANKYFNKVWQKYYTDTKTFVCCSCNIWNIFRKMDIYQRLLIVVIFSVDQKTEWKKTMNSTNNFRNRIPSIFQTDCAVVFVWL